MVFDPCKMLQTPQEVVRLEGALDEYLGLEGNVLSRLHVKRRGPGRQAMLEAVAQMAMLFASANMGSAEEFEACFNFVLSETAQDDAARRALRGFYLRNITHVPGTEDDAVMRLLLARPAIMGGPLAKLIASVPV